MKNRIINTALVLTAIVFLALLAVRVRAGATADSVAVLKTAGMTCGSCADRITTALRGIKGVAATEVDTEGGWVIVGYDTRAVRPEALAENVKKAGFASAVQEVVTPEEYRRVTGRDVGASGPGRQGCCGNRNGGCGAGTTTR
ncbi:heavy-metal-associated domain-containing protein [Geobacter sp. FeAm09]|uniref:heavy-metal-associated domain-containing protein n=1 Tax=Geobacter sp. FeAm09 TaxID=2597769 RepID=UPI0011EC8148|nr:heavy-metal-associated domain-containing protein [Geobacter sp. FeAm09]QEM67191.1 heavy-metal-associated domain-containing protein [Geobacter sp. FeAm09]